MIGIAPSLSPANAEAAGQNYLALADDERLAAERENMAA